MELIIQRKKKKPECVQGEFRAKHGDNKVEGYTLENPDMGNEKGKSSILPGKYRAWLWYSGTYNCTVIRLENKNNRTNILIHPGNRADDTLGCILPGSHRGKCAVWESRKKLEELISFIKSIGYKEKEADYTGDKHSFPVIVRDPEV